MSRPSRAARPNRTAWVICCRSSSVDASSYRRRSSPRNRPRRESSPARVQMLWAGRV